MNRILYWKRNSKMCGNCRHFDVDKVGTLVARCELVPDFHLKPRERSACRLWEADKNDR